MKNKKIFWTNIGRGVAIINPRLDKLFMGWKLSKENYVEATDDDQSEEKIKELIKLLKNE